jgi:hypothetical protein
VAAGAPTSLVALVFGILTVFGTVRTDFAVVSSAFAAVPLASPLLSAVAVLCMAWAMFCVRLPFAVAELTGRDEEDIRSRAVGGRLQAMMPIRSLRYVVWILSASSLSSSSSHSLGDSTFLAALLVLVAVPAVCSFHMGSLFRGSLARDSLLVVPYSLVVSLALHLVFWWPWRWILVLRTFLVVCCFYSGVAMLKGAWFRGAVFAGAKVFRVLAWISLGTAVWVVVALLRSV